MQRWRILWLIMCPCPAPSHSLRWRLNNRAPASLQFLPLLSASPSSHVWMWELDYKESWALKNGCFWTVVLEKTLERRAAAPVCAFSRGTMARSVSLSWGDKEVGSPCEWRGGARLYSQVIVGESGLETCWRRGRKKWQPAPVFLPRRFHGQRSLAGYSPWRCKELNKTEQQCTHTPTHIHTLGT